MDKKNMTEYIKVNLPLTEQDYLAGNGEGVLNGFQQNGGQRQCDFVIFRRTGNVRKWRIKVCSL